MCVNMFERQRQREPEGERQTQGGGREHRPESSVGIFEDG